jgi:hypothetical protein
VTPTTPTDPQPAKARARRTKRPLRISVIVPTRNAADWIVTCLEAIRASQPAEIILVDGRSDDGTVLLAEPLVDRVIRDEGQGPGAARNLGTRAARQPWVAFVDADVVLPAGALDALLKEARNRKLAALQAGLHSTGSDYWSEQLAWQHNNGRSRSWFGVSASIMQTSVALEHPFDDRLRSGEDIDLRIRLATAGMAVGVSDGVIAEHRFAPGRDVARDQWSADGAGLGRLVRKHGRPALRHLAIPFGAAAYWMAQCLVRRMPRRLPYFAGFLAGNWRGAISGLLDQRIAFGPGARSAVPLALVALWAGVLALGLLAIALLVLVALILPGIPRFLLDAVWLPVLAVIATASLVWLEIASTLPEGHRWRARAERYRVRIFILVGLTLLATVLRLGANLRLLD